MSKSLPCGKEVFLVLIAKEYSLSQGHLCTYADWPGCGGTVRTSALYFDGTFFCLADFEDNIHSTDYERGTLYHHSLGNVS